MELVGHPALAKSSTPYFPGRQAVIRRTYRGSSSLGTPQAMPAFNVATPEPKFSARVLGTSHARQVISGLRKFSAFSVEQDLQLGLAAFEDLRDERGVVTAVYKGTEVIATARAVPTGLGLTAAERLPSGVVQGDLVFSPNSWEVGRIVIAPQHRSPAILALCLSLTLRELDKLHEVSCLHATTTMPMARLWRSFGMKTVGISEGLSGARYALVCGPMSELMSRLSVVPDGEPTENETGIDSSALRFSASRNPSPSWTC